MDMLRRTAQTAMAEAKICGAKIHYALKANANEPILRQIAGIGFGADCVSGGEIERAIACGFAPQDIAFAGVGKTDDEINIALRHEIWCINCESIQELQVVNQLVAAQSRIANIAIRINPDVDAHTHSHITTGTEASKFGIPIYQIQDALVAIKSLPHLNLIGLHFHIGSQIMDVGIFASLCRKVNAIAAENNIAAAHINLGGGLGVDYDTPDEHPIPNFRGYFEVIRDNLKVKNQTVHVELGRSIVAQCGVLLTRVLYVKETRNRTFVVVDAGMTDLIRPALYGAHHHIQNLSNDQNAPNDSMVCDVVGPICESTDCFGKDIALPPTRRGDLLALRTAGAYGEIMASQYNLRRLPQAIYSAQEKNNPAK
jgi:diaminopimelate decarboxylase